MQHVSEVYGFMCVHSHTSVVHAITCPCGTRCACACISLDSVRQKPSPTRLITHQHHRGWCLEVTTRAARSKEQASLCHRVTVLASLGSFSVVTPPPRTKLHVHQVVLEFGVTRGGPEKAAHPFIRSDSPVRPAARMLRCASAAATECASSPVARRLLGLAAAP